MKPLKILQVINSLLPGGAEKLVVETSLKFIEEGHQVSILLLKSYDTPLSRQLEKNKQISIFSLGSDTNIYHPSCVFKIAKHLKRYEYDVIHAHLFPPFYWVALSKYASKKSVFIHTEHNTDNRRMSSAFYKPIERFMYKKYDCHIAISETVLENMKRHISSKKVPIELIFNGVNLAAISNAEPYEKKDFGVGKEERLIIQISAFRPQKNQGTLIRAMKLIPDAKLLLVGEGQERQKCENLVASLGLTDRISFLGIRDDVPRLLKTSDVVVLSSHYEGLSLSSVEGMASGRPFVASDVPGLTEVVENAGILFEKNDDHQLADIIKRLLKDESFYNTTVKNCIERSRKYDLDTMAKSYLGLYGKYRDSR
ncbi:glycosyltransferase [Maribacter sp. 2307UL18-2]|uniref:glycosyltransferase n=1 Tax=Maribacter sp. 2307UL18-2 TaxID=3386274 RepID=UPI0039BD7D35